MVDLFWFTYSSVFFPFSTSFPKKLIKVPSDSLSKSSFFFNCDNTVYGVLFSVNLCVHLVTFLINCAVSLIPSKSSYLY